jgi:hypothetical protein
VFVEQGDGRQMKDEWGDFEYVQGSGDDDELWGRVSLRFGPFFNESCTKEKMVLDGC